VPEVSYGNDMEDMQEFAWDFAAGNSSGAAVIMGLGDFCLLVSREAMDVLGGLDEGYATSHFEVDDLCLRSHIAGFRNVVAGNVFVHHYGGKGSGGTGAELRASLERDLRTFSEKWKELVEVDGNGCRVSMTGERQIRKLLEWGEERFSRGDFKAAMKVFLRVLRLDRANSEALNNLGVIQWQLGDALTAMATFRNSLDVNPKDPDALGNLLRAAAETGRFDLVDPELLASVRKAQPAHPDLARLVEGQPAR